MYTIPTSHESPNEYCDAAWNSAGAHAQELRDEIARLRGAALELDRLMLVIESAVRHSDLRNHEAVMALILANHENVTRFHGAAEIADLKRAAQEQALQALSDMAQADDALAKEPTCP